MKASRVEEQGKLDTRKENSQGEGCGGWGLERGRSEGGEGHPKTPGASGGKSGNRNWRTGKPEGDRGQEGRVPQVADMGGKRKSVGARVGGQWMDKDIQKGTDRKTDRPKRSNWG